MDFKVMHERCGVPAGQDLLQAVAGMNGADRHRAEEIIEAGFVSRFFCRADSALSLAGPS